MLRCVSILMFRSVSVWGGGTMGGGIAQVTAASGIPVTVVDVTTQRLEVSRKAIGVSLGRIGKKRYAGDENKTKSFVEEVLGRITFTTDEKAAASNADLIIEAVVEDIDAKKSLYEKLDKLAPPGTVFCSNTSSLRIADMAAVTNRADRFAGLHFFSPVPMMKLVEVVRTDAVHSDVVQQLTEHVQKIGKVPVVTKDTEGFIVNRLLVPYQCEAIRLVERGVASYKDVDTAMKLGCGYPMGPFELGDSVGLDVLKFIIDGWHKAEPGNPLFEPSRHLDDLVAKGKLGKKTGEGFYKYDEKGHKVD